LNLRRFLALAVGTSISVTASAEVASAHQQPAKRARPKQAAAKAPAAPATERTSGTGTVSATALNLRRGPGTGYADIGNLYKNNKVALLARTKLAYRVAGYNGAFRWYQVKGPTGAIGWSWGGYLAIGGKPPPARKPGGGTPVPAPAVAGGKAIQAFNDVGAVFAKSLNVRAAPGVNYKVIGRLTYAKVARLTARTKFPYAVAGYAGSYRWYRVQVGGLVGWAWGGFLTVGSKTPNRNPGGGAACDPKRAGCNPHTPVGGGPGNNPPQTGPSVPSSGQAISVFPVRGAHHSWHNKPCGYNDYYRGQGTNHPNGHIGNDIFGAIGTPLVAVVDGVVERAGYGGSVGGNRVTIRRGSWYFYYAHMSSVSVRQGQTVKAGTVIGTLGKSGSASGTSPHVHFSIYANDNYNAGINPFPYLQKVDPQCK